MFINWLSGEKSRLVAFTHFGRINPSIIAGFKLSTVASLSVELDSSMCVCVCVFGSCEIGADSSVCRFLFLAGENHQMKQNRPLPDQPSPQPSPLAALTVGRWAERLMAGRQVVPGRGLCIREA